MQSSTRRASDACFCAPLTAEPRTLHQHSQTTRLPCNRVATWNTASHIVLAALLLSSRGLRRRFFAASRRRTSAQSPASRRAEEGRISGGRWTDGARAAPRREGGREGGRAEGRGWHRSGSRNGRRSRWTAARKRCGRKRTPRHRAQGLSLGKTERARRWRASHKHIFLRRERVHTISASHLLHRGRRMETAARALRTVYAGASEQRLRRGGGAGGVCLQQHAAPCSLLFDGACGSP